MSVASVHPLYSAFITLWTTCRDCYLGEDQIKAKEVTYLPATPGQEADGMTGTTAKGYASYQKYLARAVFHDYVKEAVDFYLGLLWTKNPEIKLPARMEYMRKSATVQGESLEQFLMRINEEQMITGRLGILLDLPAGPTAPLDTKPYLVMYKAESIINWDESERTESSPETLNLVVLNETSFKRVNTFDWKTQEGYRVLILGDPVENEPQGSSVYRFATLEAMTEGTLLDTELKTPVIAGKSLNKIPFVFLNSKDIVIDPDVPPLHALSKLCLAIYRGEADYRQSLFLQGQDTLVIIGDDSEDEDGGQKRIGAGTALSLPSGSDAKFIGVDSSGLSEQRLALENDKKLASLKAGQLINPSTSTHRESGDALEKRVAGQTASLRHVAISSAKALEKVLRLQAEWMGLNPDEVSVTPNLDFMVKDMPATELAQYMSAKLQGAPISSKTIHEIMRKKNVTTMTYEEEIGEIEAEVPDLAGTGMNEDPNNQDSVDGAV